MSFETTFEEMIRSAEVSAVHLEMRDFYGPPSQNLADWKAGVEFDPAERFAGWVALVKDAVSRGVSLRRARIVGTPVSEYSAYLHWSTSMNIGAGESVRWLPRRLASRLCLPGNDFWVIDGRSVYWNHFDGDSVLIDVEVDDGPEAVELAADAFEAVWQRATDHEDFRVSEVGRTRLRSR